MNNSIEEFISKSKKNSAESYELFKHLLLRLENPTTHQPAVQFLAELSQYYHQYQPEHCHFKFFNQNILDKDDQPLRLDLLQFPSTFLPEAWSFTFYEGLIRYPANEYHNKVLVELGCGIGWISIALAIRYNTEIIYGLDINPKAVVCARLNLYLNAFHLDNITPDATQKHSLLKKVVFFESNLFDHFDDQKIEVDRIIGCIPQVLNPDTQIMASIHTEAINPEQPTAALLTRNPSLGKSTTTNQRVNESLTDEFLQSLSNYSEKQGQIEDQFGLGLLANAVEDAIRLLRPRGKLILNLGGRPGRSVLERLLQRRGFDVRRVWQTRVEQAADTEIIPLVNIECNTGHRFEFFLSPTADDPINASTALAYAQAGGKIYHSVDVYEGKLLFPEQVKSIFKSVAQIHRQRSMIIMQAKRQQKGALINDQINDQIKLPHPATTIRDRLDLTYENVAEAEERHSFLAFLGKHLINTDNFPYADTQGLAFFRQQLSEYFRYYQKVEISEQQICILPGRKELITNILSLYKPALSLISRKLIPLIPSPSNDPATQILEIPAGVEHLIALMQKLKPQLVISQLDIHQVQSSHIIEQLLFSAKKSNTLLVLDLTDCLDLSSQPKILSLYRYLTLENRTQNLIIIADLIYNHVYQDFYLNICITANQDYSHALNAAAELSYSRTPILTQYYYAHLLEQLLFFQRTRNTAIQKKPQEKLQEKIEQKIEEKPAQKLSAYNYLTIKAGEKTQPLTLSDAARRAFSHPAIQGSQLAFNPGTIRLDYGENELATPALLKETIFESYLCKGYATKGTNPHAALAGLLSQRFNLPTIGNMSFGLGVAPIYSALLQMILDDDKPIYIPSGNYAYFEAAADYQNINCIKLETNAADNFKITPEILSNALSKQPGGWLLLTAPIVNPTGAIYQPEELSALLTIASDLKTHVILDCIFSGLEFEQGLHWDIKNNVLEASKQSTADLIIISGLSKEYAAGGLRFGYSWTPSSQLNISLGNIIPQSPHATLHYAVEKLIRAQLDTEPSLAAHLAQQRSTLVSRAEILSTLLTKNGWHVIRPEGGLFLLATPTRFIKETGLTAIKGANLITEQLFDLQNVAINNSSWTGIAGYCRFVIAGNEQDFNQAMQRLDAFSPQVS